MNSTPPPRSRRRSSIRKPWNLSALVMAILAVALMLLAVFSVDNKPSRTGDYLQLVRNSHHSMMQKKQALTDLLKRDQTAELRSEVPAIESPSGPAMTVKIGMYAMNNYNIDPQVPSFESTGYMWFKWGDDLQAYLNKNDLKIWKVMAPINLLDIPQSADSVFVPTGQDNPIRMKDGTWYLTVAYKGTFFIDRSDFRHHPFTRLSLPIMVEADDIVLSYNSLRIEPDIHGSGIGQFVDANTGWVNLGWSLATYKHHYDTDFGFGEGASDYSQLVYEVNYATSTWSAFWKILVPLIVVMSMIVGATKMDPEQYEVRLTLPVTVLLTLVFLQQTHEAELPRLPYLTFLDEVYVVCYVLTLGSFLLMLWGCRRYYHALKIENPEDQAIELRRLDKSDDYWPTYVILSGIISIFICWFTS
jgi:hypothetical protein